MADDNVLLFDPTGAPLVARKRADNTYTAWIEPRLTGDYLQRSGYVLNFNYPFLENLPAESFRAYNIAPIDDNVTFTLQAFIAQQQCMLQQLELHTDRTFAIKHALAEREVTEEHDVLLQQIDVYSDRILQSAKFYRSATTFLHGTIESSRFWHMRELQLPKATAMKRWVIEDPVTPEARKDEVDESELLVVARRSLREWFGLSSWGELAQLLGMVRQTLHAVTDPVRQASGATVAKVLDAYVLLRAFLRSDHDERRRWLRHEGVELMQSGGYAALAAAIDEQLRDGYMPYRPGLAAVTADAVLPTLPDAPTAARDARGF